MVSWEPRHVTEVLCEFDWGSYTLTTIAPNRKVGMDRIKRSLKNAGGNATFALPLFMDEEDFRFAAVPSLREEVEWR